MEGGEGGFGSEGAASTASATSVLSASMEDLASTSSPELASSEMSVEGAADPAADAAEGGGAARIAVPAGMAAEPGATGAAGRGVAPEDGRREAEERPEGDDPAPACAVAPEDMLRMIDELSIENRPLVAGDTWYVVDASWWRAWESHCKSGGRGRGVRRIDNSLLLDSHGLLIRHLQEFTDFRVVPADAWARLHGWFGGGPELPRYVVRKRAGYGNAVSLAVDLHPIKVLLFESPKAAQLSRALAISRHATVGELLDRVASEFGFEPFSFRLWDFFRRRRGSQFSDRAESIFDARIHDGDEILIERRGENGIWALSEDSAAEADAPDASTAAPHVPGACGLQNVGNTCFMNSGLQCLSNTAPLTDYFLSGRFVADVNEGNPLGMKGEIARAYHRLIAALWSGRNTVHTPRGFKDSLEMFAPQFSGYQQHDSQELLAFLLDRLHEDLN